MSLFGPVYVILSLSRRQEDALIDGMQALGLIGEHTHGLQMALEALVAKLGDVGSGTGDLTPEQQAQVADLIAQLKTSGESLGAAEAAQPSA